MDARARRGSPRDRQLDLAVLTVNAGSTSLKRHLVEGETSRPVEGYDAAEAVGHRFVHGGTRFVQPTLIDDDVVAAIEALSSLAPLHNVPALEAIREARAALPEVPHVAVFDTSFHATMPVWAAAYAVPRRWREEWAVRRYGFHGIAVEWVASQLRVERLVVCHLGGGCSVTAVRDGKSVDTTMGFSPLEGVPMATRSGSIDPAVLPYLVREHGLSLEEVDRELERESGLAALGGLDDELGFGVFTYRIAGAVAHMSMALGGLDALAFSGGVGENRDDVREAIVDRLTLLGPFEVEVVPAHEELVIARAVTALVDKSNSKREES